MSSPTSETGWILHVDLDQFIAAVEVNRRPELRGLPVVVGGSGDPTRKRQVVATASYEARAFGVRSGMPLTTAARRCPQAVFLPTDPPAYEAASARVMATLRSFSVVVEVWGWDEAFVGAQTDDPEALAHAIRRKVLAQASLSCSVGIGDTKLRAKMATGLAKPAGVHRLTAGNWIAVMGDRPTAELWGVGAKTARRLEGLGLHTVSDLAQADPHRLAESLGPTMGPWFVQLARGGSDTRVSSEPWVARSRSHETTFAEDLTELSDIEGQVVRLAREVAEEVLADGRVVTRVAVKVRSSTFFTQTRIRKLPAPTTAVGDIEQAALQVLGRFELTRPVRLLGVRLELAPRSPATS